MGCRVAVGLVYCWSRGRRKSWAIVGVEGRGRAGAVLGFRAAVGLVYVSYSELTLPRNTAVE